MRRLRNLMAIAALWFLLPVSVQAQGTAGGDAVDAVFEYVPYASVFALKACGVESRDNWTQLVVGTAASWVFTAGVTYTLKHTIHEWRPDHTDQRSFPSGHSAFAFAGATMLHKEYGKVSPWISVAGYSVATLTAVSRVARDRHHWYDAAAGAGIGILSTELTYYVTDKFFKGRNVRMAFSGDRLDLAIHF